MQLLEGLFSTKMSGQNGAPDVTAGGLVLNKNVWSKWSS